MFHTPIATTKGLEYGSIHIGPSIKDLKGKKLAPFLRKRYIHQNTFGHVSLETENYSNMFMIMAAENTRRSSIPSYNLCQDLGFFFDPHVFSLK